MLSRSRRAATSRNCRLQFPDAHRWYDESGDAKRYATWEAFFSGWLANRFYYFFRKHADGKIVVAVAEWPGTVQDGMLIAPGSKEQEEQRDHCDA
jgi:hypothetical protein